MWLHLWLIKKLMLSSPLLPPFPALITRHQITLTPCRLKSLPFFYLRWSRCSCTTSSHVCVGSHLETKQTALQISHSFCRTFDHPRPHPDSFQNRCVSLTVSCSKSICSPRFITEETHGPGNKFPSDDTALDFMQLGWKITIDLQPTEPRACHWVRSVLMQIRFVPKQRKKLNSFVPQFRETASAKQQRWDSYWNSH